MNYRVGTRGSSLALAQTNQVIEELKRAYPEDSFEVVKIETTGDLRQDIRLDTSSGKGIFVDTIEQALCSGQIDLAVHSMKDMDEEPAKGLVFAKAWRREDPRDVLISKGGLLLRELPLHARIGTGSKRREAELLEIRPDLTIVPIRGNVDTRIRKLREEDLDGIILAAAGLKRIHRDDEITEYFSEEEMIPAACQGVLALELREDDTVLMEKLNALSDEVTGRIVETEMAFVHAMHGDCHLPVGAYAREEADGRMTLFALFGREDGSALVRTSVTAEDGLQAAEEAARIIRAKLG